MTNEVDVRENYILKIDRELLSLLLFDHTTRNNIFWATDNYIKLGKGFQADDEITIERVTGEYGSLVKPRVKKTKAEQIARVRDKAIDDFLHVRFRKDEYSNTQNIMALAKKFVTKELPKEYEVSKTEQIDLLNKSLYFFKGKEKFDLNDFANEVIGQPDAIKKFQQFKKNYEEANDIAIDDQFTISDAARKKQQRSYKRVIHLDKKIQIIVDGNSDHIEQGKDAKGKFYKVYYNEEN